MHVLNAVERAYERLWSMAYRTWQIEHRGEFRLALLRATSLPRGNKRDYIRIIQDTCTMAFWLCFTWWHLWLLVHRHTRAPPSWSMYRRHSCTPRKPRAAIVQLQLVHVQSSLRDNSYIMGTAQIHISEISNYVLRINYTHTHARTHTHFLCSLAGNSAMHSASIYKGCK